jgi:septal ring factor EnvC (AmiA/AmiB activator)
LRRLALLLVLLAGPALAQTPAELQAAEKARAAQVNLQRDAAARAAAAKQDEARLAGAQAALLARLRAAELATNAAATTVAQLDARQRAAAARLALRSADIAPLLPVLARLRSFPAETMLALPMPAEDAVRGMLVMGGLAREIEADAAALRAEQAAVAALQAELDAALPKLNAAQTAQVQAARELDAALQQTRATRRAAEQEADQAAQHAAEEAARADSLRTAIAQIEAARKAAEEQARREALAASRQKRDKEAASARERQEALARPVAASGAMTAPVEGGVARGFGQASDAGTSTGIAYNAAPGARVVSPCSGRVMFAAPFRSYGLLAIVDCGGGTHAVLAGFERLDAKVGQRVQAGAPVGVMPGWDPRGGGARPQLYVELRRDGQPVDPGPYLRAKG